VLCVTCLHGLQEVAVNSKNLSEAHVQAADLLTELYSNLKEDQLLMLQMSIAIWRKVWAHLQQSVDHQLLASDIWNLVHVCSDNGSALCLPAAAACALVAVWSLHHYSSCTVAGCAIL